MNEYVRFLLVAVVVFLTHFQQGITGFGCTMLALPFVTLLLGLKTAVSVLVIIGWIIALFIVIESRRHIIWREFLHIAIPVGLTMPLGIWMANILPANTLKLALAAFATAVGVEGLIKRDLQPAPVSSRSRLIAGCFLPLGGVLHGAFGSGGPLVIIYATRAITDKTVFRVTLCLLWAFLNTLLIGSWIRAGSLTPQILKITAFCFSFGLLGVWLGNRVHYRTDGMVFRKIVYTVLIIAGLVLGWSVFEMRGMNI